MLDTILKFILNAIIIFSWARIAIDLFIIIKEEIDFYKRMKKNKNKEK